MSSRLDEIIQRKRADLRHSFRTVHEAEFRRFAGIARPSFVDAIAQPEAIGIIAEIKRRSPSAGSIRDDADPVDFARTYVNGGADALSVLTDTPYFGGKMEDLWQVTEFLAQHQRAIPVLRKDFTVHPIQILEAAEAGASAILLIVAALGAEELQSFRAFADRAGLDSIFEVHDERELETALNCGAAIIGVNNRNLHTFETDLAVSESLLPQIPEGIIAIAESGIHTPADIARVQTAGADAVLIGESLMRARNPEERIAEFKTIRAGH